MPAGRLALALTMHVETTSIANAKAALRAQLKAARAALPPAARATYSQAICTRLLNLPEMQQARRLFVFISYGSEVHTHELIARLLAEGCEISVPRIIDKQYMIACRLGHWADLKPAELGILTPQSTIADTAPFDIVITPGLGFTPHGDRIGFGAGYYDRWLAGNQIGQRIALAYEVQIVPAIPTGPHDLPVDAIVTESRIIRPARP